MVRSRGETATIQFFEELLHSLKVADRKSRQHKLHLRMVCLLPAAGFRCVMYSDRPLCTGRDWWPPRTGRVFPPAAPRSGSDAAGCRASSGWPASRSAERNGAGRRETERRTERRCRKPTVNGSPDLRRRSDSETNESRRHCIPTAASVSDRWGAVSGGQRERLWVLGLESVPFFGQWSVTGRPGITGQWLTWARGVFQGYTERPVTRLGCPEEGSCAETIMRAPLAGVFLLLTSSLTPALAHSRSRRQTGIKFTEGESADVSAEHRRR